MSEAQATTSTVVYERKPSSEIRPLQPTKYPHQEIFGANQLTAYKHMHSENDFTTDTNGEFITKKQVPEALRERLKKLHEFSGTKKYVEDFYFSYTKDHPEFGSDYAGTGLEFPGAVSMFDPRLVSDTVFMDMVASHVDQVKRKTEKLQERIPESVEKFKKNFAAAVARGVIPEVDINDRLKGVAYGISDPLVSLPQEKWGSFHRDSNTVLVSDDVPYEFFDHIMTHELLHAISGRSMHVKFQEKRNDRVGLIFTIRDKDEEKEGYRERFRWLNEAVTEMLTAEIIGKEAKFYGIERGFVEHFMSKGEKQIPFRLFADAYFEDMGSDTPVGERMPAWKKLQHELGEAFLPEVLKRFDIIIQKQGLNAGYDTLQRGLFIKYPPK